MKRGERGQTARISGASFSGVGPSWGGFCLGPSGPAASNKKRTIGCPNSDAFVRHAGRLKS